MKGKAFLRSAVLIGALVTAPMAAFAHEGTVHVQINGVEVRSQANHIAGGSTYVDVAAYASLIGAKYAYNANNQTITVNNRQIKVHVINGVPTAPIRELAKATGAEKIMWDEKSTTAYVLDLPDGTIQLTPSVPGMGEHWGNPKDLPVGPIYGVEDGKLVFIEQMLKQEDFANGKNFENIAGMKGLPSPSVDHTDIDFQPNGHEGFEIPHYDLHHYFVSHEEHLQFGKQTAQIEAIKNKLQKYEDISVAEKDGYMKITEFVPQMGYHYMNPKAVGTDMPNILLYTEVNGKLTLVGAEWGTPDPQAKSPIDGTSFKLTHKASAHYKDGSELEVADPKQAPKTNPKTGAEFVQWHPDLYGMHLWFIPNPNGPFADFNPNLNEPGSGSSAGSHNTH
ncbi:exported hypothetical protein [[Clostridium] ultunense Esp]|nr:exported hypothetical protein [[Clostridium] ultunense Esp]